MSSRHCAISNHRFIMCILVIVMSKRHYIMQNHLFHRYILLVVLSNCHYVMSNHKFVICILFIVMSKRYHNTTAFVHNCVNKEPNKFTVSDKIMTIAHNNENNVHNKLSI